MSALDLVTRRVATSLAALILAVAGLSACSPGDERVIALLLPDSGATRWTERDQLAFQRAVEAGCPSCELEVSIAMADPGLQADQLHDALDAGADVIVLAAVSTEAGESLLRAAGETPVIAYDRFIAGADYYVSFDNQAVGRLQAQALVAATGTEPRLLVLNGAQGDPNATALRLAAGKVLTASGAQVLATADPDDWHTDTAQQWVTAQLDRLSGDRVDGVYAGNDAQAAGVVAALKAAGHPLVPVTGQDGELAALQRIIRGEQFMTVYKPVADEATRAATLAVQLIGGGDITPPTTEVEGVPSYILDPVAVTVANLTDAVVRDGLVTIDQLCTPELLAACERQGIL